MNGSKIAITLLCLLGTLAAQERHPEELRAKLPESEALEIARGQLRLNTPAGSYRVVDVSPLGDPVLQLGADRVTVDDSFLLGGDLALVASAPELARIAREAGLALDVFTLEERTLAGPVLASRAHMVMLEGILMPVEITASEDPDLAEALAKTRTALGTAQVGTDLARRSIAIALEVLEDPDLGGDTLSVELIRRLIRDGWLRDLIGEAAGPLELVVDARTRPSARERWVGDGLRLEVLSNAYGVEATVLTTPLRTVLRRSASQPAYHPNAPETDLTIFLRGGSDPFSFDEAAVQAAEITANGERLARWDRDGGFVSDAAAWKDSYGISLQQARDANLTPGFMPPHVVVTDLVDNVLALHTAHGSVRPSPDDAEAFLSSAAEALPDAAHLDLVGEYLFAYVNDSPDPRRPFLIGSDDLHGEIHQTIAQTLATDAGGVCRGDCDDLAELYYDLARRQGRLAHIIELPGHAALMWAEREGTNWRTQLLQTGPPLSFTGDTLPDALRASYEAFGLLDLFDPDQVGIAVRFSGENIRSSWVLGWRIFRDADYARTMIDIQQDWHEHTYLRGIVKVQEMIANGDEDPANFRELAGLRRATGQWSAAAAALELAAEKTGDPTMTLALDRMVYLFLAEQEDAARAIARDLIDKQFPEKGPALGPAFSSLAMRLSDVLSTSGKEVDMATEVQEKFLSTTMARLVAGLGVQIDNGLIDPADFRENPQLRDIRFLLRGWYASVMAIVEQASPDELAESESLQQLAESAGLWVRSLAFHDYDLPGDLAMRYAQAAGYVSPFLGADVLDAAVAGASFPKGPREDHPERASSLVQFQRDLPWIKASIPHFAFEIVGLFDKEEKTLDIERLKRLHDGLQAARKVAPSLGLDHPQAEAWILTAETLHAMSTEDAGALTRLLRQVAEADDKILRESLVSLMGLAARHTTPEWWGQVLDLFQRHLNHRQSWFNIAWTAALNEAPEHAVIAAERGVAAFPENTAFTEERDFLSLLLSARGN